MGESVDALPAIEGERHGTHQLGELAAGDPTTELHLEEALAGLEVSLHAERVPERPGAHGRNAAGVEADLDPRGEAGKAGHAAVRELIA